MVWVETKKWNETWILDAKLKGGGQGQGYRVHRRGDEGRFFFLKELKSQNDHERRARFYMEAQAYDVPGSSHIPRLVESNTQNYENRDFKLYLVTEFVCGETLADWREVQANVSFSDALYLFRSLLLIVKGLHERGRLHRDIKPENIILRDNDPTQPVLLDFGLSFIAEKGGDSQSLTYDGQELGNRFLRLPELSAGSDFKRSPETDITFCSGIFFYVLTGHRPDQLQDAHAKLPHQRDKALIMLNNIPDVGYPRLANFFDRAFQPGISRRFSSVNQVLSEIEVMVAMKDNLSTIDEIREIIESTVEKIKAEEVSLVDGALDSAMHAYGEVMREYKNHLTVSHVDRQFIEHGGFIRLRWDRVTPSQYLGDTDVNVNLIGDQLVWKLDNEEVFRMAGGDFSYDSIFVRALADKIHEQVLSALRRR